MHVTGRLKPQLRRGEPAEDDNEGKPPDIPGSIWEATRELHASVERNNHGNSTRSGIVGAALYVVGLFLIVTGMLLLFRTVFNKWLLVPIAVGMVLAIMGAHVAASKRVGAAIKEMSAAIFKAKK